MTVPRAAEGTVLERGRRAPPIAIDRLAPPGGLLIVAPHPDDESFGCGLALAAATVRGRRIGIVLLTGGEGSHPGSIRYRARRLRLVRRREMTCALRMLTGPPPPPVLRLQLPDGRSDGSMLTPARFSAVRALATRIGARSIWTSWAGDPHCDHRTAALLGRRIARTARLPLWEYIVWGRFGNRAPPRGLRRFAAPSLVRRKRRAIACHASQQGRLVFDDPTGFVMPPEIVRHLAAEPELFVRA